MEFPRCRVGNAGSLPVVIEECWLEGENARNMMGKEENLSKDTASFGIQLCQILLGSFELYHRVGPTRETQAG